MSALLDLLAGLVRLCQSHVSAVSEANGTTVPVSLDLGSSLSIQPSEGKPLAGAAGRKVNECYRDFSPTTSRFRVAGGVED
jgi:hypothetical protein